MHVSTSTLVGKVEGQNELKEAFNVGPIVIGRAFLKVSPAACSRLSSRRAAETFRCLSDALNVMYCDEEVCLLAEMFKTAIVYLTTPFQMQNFMLLVHLGTLTCGQQRRA